MAAEKLISLDAVTKKIEDEIKACPLPDPEDPPSEVFVKRTIPKLLQDVIDYLKKQPTVEAVEVVHGRWVNPYTNRYGHPCHCCSECGFKASYQDKNYCPQCGAKMDGGGSLG